MISGSMHSWCTTIIWELLKRTLDWSSRFQLTFTSFVCSITVTSSLVCWRMVDGSIQALTNWRTDIDEEKNSGNWELDTDLGGFTSAQQERCISHWLIGYNCVPNYLLPNTRKCILAPISDNRVIRSDRRLLIKNHQLFPEPKSQVFGSWKTSE